MHDIKRVKHYKFGVGVVEFEKPTTSLVRFETGFQECLNTELEPIADIKSDIKSGKSQTTSVLALKTLAETLKSINENWSVFSKSNINLLPHQLWVCHRALRQWPINQLIADDVGLGKTIEAGLILWPLIAKKQVRRLLVLTPAPLVEQWQQRMLSMFDIRLTLYSPQNDTDRTHYWDCNNMVVASLPTLRLDKDNQRLIRMLNAEPWDMLIVDEAHHLNANEHDGGTLGYRFVEQLIKNDKFTSKLFFTATPHRGKEHGFFALLHLLRPDLFMPKKMNETQMRKNVKEVLIRNNKSNVTDMNGKRLFQPLHVSESNYSYSPEEQNFYDLLTKFIISGEAYASSLNVRDQKAVQLVLIAMQKLASSSIAAIKQALYRRIKKYDGHKDRLEQIETERQNLEAEIDLTNGVETDAILMDKMSSLDTEFVETSIKVQLMGDELPRIEELIDACNKITTETRIETILDILETNFKDRTVVFFTEYKATQALLMGALNQTYGEGKTVFINGENHLKKVKTSTGEYQSYSMQRHMAAQLFNEGKARFIISTEAGGEGIDLQKNCHSMIHVDLPWNPMRLHQRVGRLNRYGQQKQVDVILLRNPDTVESHIWNLLNEKIERIMHSVGGAMDEPENLMELILGLSDNALYNALFAKASTETNMDSLDEWFDHKTKTFGGESIIQKVTDLVGRAEKFNYQDLDEVPKLDLPDLKPFFSGMLAQNQRRAMKNDEKDEVGNKEHEGISFHTPKEWLGQFGTKRFYENIYFCRDPKDKPTNADIMGFGHPMFAKAIEQAITFDGTFTNVDGIDANYIIFKVQDQLTGTAASIKTSIIGVKIEPFDNCHVLKDEELVHFLNAHIKQNSAAVNKNLNYDIKLELIDSASTYLESNVHQIGLPFKLPTIQLLSAFFKQEIMN